MTMPAQTSDVSVPLSAEELVVEKRQVVASDVRVHVGTIVRQVPVKELLTDDRIEVEHVPIGRYVDAALPVRQEGDTTIISLVEEVIERRLILREEVHLRRVRTTRTYDETVALREEKVTVERTVRAAPVGPNIVQATGAEQSNQPIGI